jgi:alkylation response protein AidB-like acyl-CoA dehydrogenase
MTISEQTVPVLSSVDEALAAARAVAADIAVGAVERELSGQRPERELGRVAESGLLGILVPAEFGGPELPLSTPVEVLRILSVGDSAVGQLLLAHYVLSAVLRGLGDKGPAPQLYRDVLGGAQLGNATVERGTRTSAERLTTVRRGPNDDWVLTGKKFYATGSLGAAWIAVAARIEGTEPSHSATAFVRPSDPGVTLNLDKWSAFGQRGTASGEVILDQVAVSDAFVVDDGPDLDPATAPPTVFGAYDQALHAAIDIGIARAALEDGARFVATRSRPWFEADVDSAAEEPHVVRRFGELTARLYALEALLAHGSSLIDQALAAPELTHEGAAEASLKVAAAKALAQEFAVEIASGIFELAGTSATDGKYALDRHWRNVRVHSLHDPARWKYVHLGNYTLNATLPPRKGLLL